LDVAGERLNGEPQTASNVADRSDPESPDIGTTVSAERQPDRPAERRVTIGSGLLDKLESVQDKLDRHVRGYISLQEQRTGYATAGRLLARAKAEPHRLKDDFFQDQLAGCVNDLRPLRSALSDLERLMEPQLFSTIGVHDKLLDAARVTMMTVRNPSQEADAIAAVDTIYRSLESMRQTIDDLSSACERAAEHLLVELRTVVANIFAIDANRRRGARAPTSAPVERRARGEESSASRVSQQTPSEPDTTVGRGTQRDFDSAAGGGN
jgi:hypothetical protein